MIIFLSKELNCYLWKKVAKKKSALVLLFSLNWYDLEFNLLPGYFGAN